MAKVPGQNIYYLDVYMKIGFFSAPTLTGRQNGIVSQALTWRAEMLRAGHTVELISPWESVDWSSFDVVHVFGISPSLDLMKKFKEKGAKSIAISPIFDSNRPTWLMKILSFFQIPFLNCKTPWAYFRQSLAYCDLIFVRSEYEQSRLKSIFDIDLKKTFKVALSPRFEPKQPSCTTERENFCLHVSILSSPNKNVLTLIEAAKQFGFDLRLAGHINTSSFANYVMGEIKLNPNISYLGVLEDGELQQCFQKAKVFALPSLIEGVGLVALEAAALGCDIVITNRGGPKEYYGELARVVDPEDISEVGESIMYFLEGGSNQPALTKMVLDEYKLSTSVDKIIGIYSAQKGS